jgi:23S rRNA U2552 (ribose-2'-O)-methylase RlmE/FtsJ
MVNIYENSNKIIQKIQIDNKKITSNHNKKSLFATNIIYKKITQMFINDHIYLTTKYSVSTVQTKYITLYEPFYETTFMLYDNFKYIVKYLQNKNNVLCISHTPSFLEALQLFKQNNNNNLNEKMHFMWHEFMYNINDPNYDSLVSFNKYIQPYLDKNKQITHEYTDFYNFKNINNFKNIPKRDLILIYSISTEKSKQNDFPMQIRYLNVYTFNMCIYSLHALNNNGNLIIYTLNILLKETQQIIHLLSKYFVTVHIKKNIGLNDRLSLICTNFKGISKEDLDFLNKTSQEIDSKIKNDDDYLDNIFDIEKNDIYYKNQEIIDAFNNEYKQILESNYKKYKFYASIINNNELIDKLYEDRKFLQLKKCMQWCYENDIIVKPKYKKSIIDYEHKIINKLYSSSNVLSRSFIPINSKPIIQITDVNNKLDQLKKLKNKLNLFTSAMETRDFKKWRYVARKLQTYGELHKMLDKGFNVGSDHHNVSNAFTKLYEVLEYHQLIDYNKESIDAFHICEAPGNFIYSTNHYLKSNNPNIKYNWHANSLNPFNQSVKDKYGKVFSDDYKLMKHYKNKWIFGENNGTGDITNVKNIKYFLKTINKVDFISGDCGLWTEQSKSDEQEVIMGQINFAQIIVVLTMLKEGGSFVVKHYTPMTQPVIISYLYLLNMVFDEIFIMKPLASRPSTRELYLGGSGFKGIDNDILEQLYGLLENFDHKVMFMDVPDKFIKQHTDIMNDLIRTQIISINRTYYFYDDMDKLKEHENDIEFHKRINIKLWAKKNKFKSINNKDKI